MAAILPAVAQVPQLLEYDGFLSGNITGNRTMGVRLYNASKNGTLLYKETIGTVKVTSGEFYFQYGQNGTLGNGTTPTTISAVLTGSQNWLAVTVNGTEQTPRAHLLSVPFALRSADAQKTDADLRKVVDALGKVVVAFGGNASNLLSNPAGTIATMESTAKNVLEMQKRFRVIGLSGNLAFGNSSTSRSFTISNAGFDRLTVSGISYPAGFSGNWSGVVPIGGSQAVTVNFRPTAVKSYSGNITVSSDAKSGVAMLPLSGIGARSISVSGNLAFGYVTPNTTATRNFTISNTGTMNLTVSGITFPVGFSVNWSGTIAAGTSQNIAVTFAPIGVQNYSGNITVSSDATSGSVSIPSFGTGVAPLVTVSTLAGSGSAGYADGQGSSASFKWIGGVAVDRSGNVYVADTLNHRIRKVTANGTVSTLAGSGNEAFADGQGTSASFYRPKGVTVDVIGNVYVADAANTRIRKITASGNVTTLAGGSYGYADGQGTSAGFNWPVGVAVDKSGNVYVADSLGHRIRKITPSGNVSTLAGSGSIGYADGLGSSASFNRPGGVAADGNGNVYVADSDNNRVRKIAPNGMVATLAGSGTAGYADGQGSSASFNRPLGVAVDGSGSVYVADANNSRIRKITANGTVSTLAGGDSGYADGSGSSAKFYYPIGIAVDENDNLYVADYGDSRIRKITISQ